MLDKNVHFGSTYMYRVAQNTPPDNVQYLCNQWSDFKNSWSRLILTLLWN